MEGISTVTISKDGSTVTIDNSGYVGTICSDITNMLAESLGEVTAETYKEEYYATVDNCIDCSR